MSKQPSISILLRALEPADIDLLFIWENDRKLWQVSNTLAPFSRHILEKYIESSHQDIYETKQLRLMIDYREGNANTTVGAIDLFDFDPFHQRAGVGILIYADEHKNRGLASRALQELVDYAFNTLLLHQLYCNITVDNQVSLSIFKKAGFNEIGIKRDWIRTPDGFLDEVILQLIRP